MKFDVRWTSVRNHHDELLFLIKQRLLLKQASLPRRHGLLRKLCSTYAFGIPADT